MYKLKVDMLFREPIVLKFKNYDDARYVKQDIEHTMKMDMFIHLNSEHGYPGKLTINPVYIRTLEVVEE